MIAQIWRGSTRAADREACVAQLLPAIHAALADCATCNGAYLLARSTGGSDVELMVLTLFDEAAVTSRRDDAARYRAAALDKPPALVLGSSVAVYEVLTEPRRTSSYARLRRRFPPGVMTAR